MKREIDRKTNLYSYFVIDCGFKKSEFTDEEEISDLLKILKQCYHIVQSVEKRRKLKPTSYKGK